MIAIFLTTYCPTRKLDSPAKENDRFGREHNKKVIGKVC